MIAASVMVMHVIGLRTWILLLGGRADLLVLHPRHARHLVLMMLRMLRHPGARPNGHQSHDESHGKVSDVLAEGKPMRLFKVVGDAVGVVRAKPQPISGKAGSDQRVSKRHGKHPPHAKQHGSVRKVVPLLAVGHFLAPGESAYEIPEDTNRKHPDPDGIRDVKPGGGEAGCHAGEADCMPKLVFAIKIAIDRQNSFSRSK